MVNLSILGLPVVLFFINTTIIFFHRVFEMGFKKRCECNWLISYGGLLVTALVLLILTRSYFFTHCMFILSIFLVLKNLPKVQRRREIAIAVVLTVFLGLVVEWRHDVGVLINYLLGVGFTVFFIYVLLLSSKFEEGRYKFLKGLGMFSPLLVILLFIMVVKLVSKPSLDDEGRAKRRVSAIIHKDNALATGGKQFLSDAQFFATGRIKTQWSLLRSQHFYWPIKKNRFIRLFLKDSIPWLLTT